MVFSFFFSLSNLLSFMVMILGILWSLESVGVFGLWIGMELSFFGVIGILGSSSIDESECLVKYFVVQVVGSMFVMVFLMLILSGLFEWFVELVLLVGLSVKLGLFPFHFWVPSVSSGLSWGGCIVVLIIQKLIPLWFFVNFCLFGFFLSLVEFSCMMTCLIGCVGGLMILHYRVLLSYSSLNHLGFMVILSIVDVYGLLMYFIVYFLINVFLMVSLWVMSVYSFFDFLKNKMGSVWVSVYLLSLGGVPPFLGSFLKVVFLLVCFNFFPLVCVIMLFSSAVGLYFYMTFFLSIYFSLGSVWDLNLKVVDFLGVISLLVNVVFSLVMFLFVGLM
uniref:NADH-ubiquinone oxidoreductase chain 2 n=1 Tax=Geloina coaxans TaxID=499929 RepID=A0A0R8SP43_9BIVA|nr:NADH dehydrogenase subunit 2 [Geloina coaxans]